MKPSKALLKGEQQVFVVKILPKEVKTYKHKLTMRLNDNEKYNKVSYHDNEKYIKVGYHDNEKYNKVGYHLLISMPYSNEPRSGKTWHNACVESVVPWVLYISVLSKTGLSGRILIFWPTLHFCLGETSFK